MIKIYRTKEDAKIAGVCTGIGNHFKVDPIIIRLIFLFALLIGGGGLVLYIIAWIIIPLKEH